MLMKARTATSPRPRRFARYAGVLGFTGALLTGIVLSSAPPEDATAAACSQGEHRSWSKYAGSVCIPDGGDVGKGVATVTVGCGIGLLSGGLPGLGWGCFGASMSVLIDGSFN